MNNINFSIAKPGNEKALGYVLGSDERLSLQKELERQSNIVVDVVMPHNHGHVLARFHQPGASEIAAACSAVVCTHSYPTFASHRLNGSTLVRGWTE